MSRDMTWGDPQSAAGRDILALAREVRSRNPEPGTYLFHWRNGQYCLAAADGDWGRLADAAAQTAAAKAPAGQWTHYDHFGLIVLLGLRAWAGKRFPGKARAALAEMILHECAGRGGAFRNDFEFENDNFPFMAVAIEILGGEMTGRRDMARHGLIKLIQAPSDRSSEETVKLLTEVMQLSKQPQERRSILSVLPNYPVKPALALAEAASKDAAVAREAKAAADQLKEVLPR